MCYSSDHAHAVGCNKAVFLYEGGTYDLSSRCLSVRDVKAALGCRMRIAVKAKSEFCGYEQVNLYMIHIERYYDIPLVPSPLCS